MTGSHGTGRGWLPRPPPLGRWISEKFLKFLLKTGAKTYPSLAITPIEGHLVVESGENDFFEKVGKSLIVPEKEMRLGKETSRKMKEEWMQLDTQ